MKASTRRAARERSPNARLRRTKGILSHKIFTQQPPSLSKLQRLSSAVLSLGKFEGTGDRLRERTRERECACTTSQRAHFGHIKQGTTLSLILFVCPILSRSLEVPCERQHGNILGSNLPINVCGSACKRQGCHGVISEIHSSWSVYKYCILID